MKTCFVFHQKFRPPFQRWRAHDRKLMQLDHLPDDRRRAGCIAKTPTGHGVSFGKTVDQNGTFPHPVQLGNRDVPFCIRATINPGEGEEVLIPEPCFVCYDPLTRMAGGVPVPIATRVEDDFRLTAAQLREHLTPKTKLLILPFPNNPTDP